MKKIGIFLCVFWIGIIFYNSSQPDTILGGVTENVAKNIIITVNVRMLNQKNISTTNKVHNLIRKLCYGLEFFILAILVIYALSKENVNNKDLIIRILFIVVMLAISDEYL